MSVELEDAHFEALLSTLDLSHENAFETLEKELGLDRGGSWWLDPEQPPIESGENATKDKLIADVETKTLAWIRSSFDQDPEFVGNNFNLLTRLNELAVIKGLVEQVALRHHYTSSERINQWKSSDPAQAYLEMVERYPKNRDQDPNRGPVLGELTIDTQQQPNRSPIRNSTFSLRSTERLVLPALQKSQQPPSPHHSHFQRSNSRIYPSAHSLAVPDATSSPDSRQFIDQRSNVLLNRTYSKEGLDQLRDHGSPFPRRSGGSLLDSLLRPGLNQSGGHSGHSSDADVSLSFDGAKPDLLSHSLTDGEIQSLRRSGPRNNASYSSIQATNILEIAREQESRLRKQSGSRGKLTGSNSSLTASFNGEGSSDLEKSRSLLSSSIRASHDGVVELRASPRCGLTASLDPAINLNQKDVTRSAEAFSDVSNGQLISSYKKASSSDLHAMVDDSGFVGSVPDTAKPIKMGSFFSNDQELGGNFERLDSQKSFEELESRISHETFLLSSYNGPDVVTSLSDSFPDGQLLRQGKEPSQSSLFSNKDTKDDSLKRSNEEEGNSRQPLQPSGLRPLSKYPAPSSRIPMPSGMPTISHTTKNSFRSLQRAPPNSRPTPGSISSRPASRQPMTQLLPRNQPVKTQVEDSVLIRPNPVSKSATGTTRSSGRSISRTASSVSSRPITRSDTSPVRSVSRRFGQQNPRGGPSRKA